MSDSLTDSSSCPWAMDLRAHEAHVETYRRTLLKWGTVTSALRACGASACGPLRGRAAKHGRIRDTGQRKGIDLKHPP